MFGIEYLLFNLTHTLTHLDAHSLTHIYTCGYDEIEGNEDQVYSHANSLILSTVYLSLHTHNHTLTYTHYHMYLYMMLC